jgi:hypothetical protein
MTGIAAFICLCVLIGRVRGKFTFFHAGCGKSFKSWYAYPPKCEECGEWV